VAFPQFALEEVFRFSYGRRPFGHKSTTLCSSKSLALVNATRAVHLSALFPLIGTCQKNRKMVGITFIMPPDLVANFSQATWRGEKPTARLTEFRG
jgi:hypothetical protein